MVVYFSNNLWLEETPEAQQSCVPAYFHQYILVMYQWALSGTTHLYYYTWVVSSQIAHCLFFCSSVYHHIHEYLS